MVIPKGNGNPIVIPSGAARSRGILSVLLPRPPLVPRRGRIEYGLAITPFIKGGQGGFTIGLWSLKIQKSYSKLETSSFYQLQPNFRTSPLKNP